MRAIRNRLARQARLRFTDELPGGAVQRPAEPEHGIQARVTPAVLEEADIRGMAVCLGCKRFLGHTGAESAHTDDFAEVMRCRFVSHIATLGDCDYCLNRR